MKPVILIPLLFFLQSYRPFTQEGSVDPNTDEMDERIDKAQRNAAQEKRAKKVIREEQQSDEKLNRKLEPDILFNKPERKVRRFNKY